MVRGYDEVQAERAAEFEMRRQAAIAEMLAQPDTAALSQARDNIANLCPNAVDWLSFSQSHPKFEMARASMCRVEMLALIGYSILAGELPYLPSRDGDKVDG